MVFTVEDGLFPLQLVCTCTYVQAITTVYSAAVISLAAVTDGVTAASR